MNNLDELEKYNSEPTVSVHFGITSLTRKLTELTVQLGIEPSHSFQLGDKINSRTGTHSRGRSVWQLRSEGNVNSNNLEEHLVWLLNKIEPPCRVIQQYLDDPDVEVDIRINCRCSDTVGGVSIRSITMQRLAIISNRIDISFIGEPDRDNANGSESNQ